jgi:hypothetical protein
LLFDDGCTLPCAYATLLLPLLLPVLQSIAANQLQRHNALLMHGYCLLLELPYASHPAAVHVVYNKPANQGVLLLLCALRSAPVLAPAPSICCLGCLSAALLPACRAADCMCLAL